MQIYVIYVKLTTLSSCKIGKTIFKSGPALLCPPLPTPNNWRYFHHWLPPHGGALWCQTCKLLCVFYVYMYVLLYYLGLYIYRYKSATTLKAKNYEKNSKRFFLFPPMIFFIILVPVVLVHTASQFSLNFDKTVVAGKLFLKLAFLVLNYLNKSREELAPSQPVPESRLTSDIYLTLRVTTRVSREILKTYLKIIKSNISLNLFRFKKG